MKRFASILLLLVMLFSLVACGSDAKDNAADDPVSGVTDSSKPEKDNDSKPAKDKTPSGPLEVVDHVKAAMEASNHLTTSNYLLAKDGSVIVMREYNDENALIYAKMPGVKKLCASASGSKLFALTEDNCLYQGETKLAENVTDVDYATTNSNEAGRLLIGSDIFRHDSMGMRSSPVNEYFLQHKTDGNVKISGTPAYMCVDKHDFIVVTDTGEVYLDATNEVYIDHECFSWKNMAMADIARAMSWDGKFLSLTIAGIQADGTVMASGDYAADILGWGELSYLAMGNTIIAGLKKDGTVVVTGQSAEGMGEIVSGWSNIVAIEVGYGARFGDFISAMDADGNFYYASYYQNSYQSYTVSPDDGVTGTYACKYTPDGTLYYADEGAWSVSE